MKFYDFSMDKVRVTDRYYMNSLKKENEYLLFLDTDRLLAGFRETAGKIAGMDDDQINKFMKGKERYTGGWENALIGGHTLGHFLTAIAQSVANAGTDDNDRKALKNTLDYVVASLAECQEKTVGTEYEGYIFGAVLVKRADIDIQFDNVEEGKSNIFTEAWVPWYTMHKIVAGLISVCELTEDEASYNIVKRLGKWIADRVIAWSEDKQKTVLSIEYGGMNDCLYSLYNVVKTKEGSEEAEIYKAAAHMFDEVYLFELVSDAGKKNRLNDRHANTTIPKFLGALNRYNVLGDKKYLGYAETFWEYVTKHHSYITGGNSEWEHFGADDILDKERTACNCETCNTYNMLKLTRQLYKITGNKKYTDYYENTFINAIMSSQNPETGMTMYFQPMASGYQKVFGEPDTNFWCCTGSGMENFTKLNDSIYYYVDKTLVISQYLASEVDFVETNAKVIQDVNLLEDNVAKIKIETLDKEKDVCLSLRLRLPEWLSGKAVITADGEEVSYQEDNGYAVISSDIIKAGTEIYIELPMEVKAYNLPDGKSTYAFKYGPYVLSAKLGTDKKEQGTTGVQVSVPVKSAVSNDEIVIQSDMTVEEYMSDIAENMVKADGCMEFTLKGTDKKYIFVPHFSQYKESYGIYWRFLNLEDKKVRDEEVKKNNTLTKYSVVEAMRPGYGQDELGFKEEGNGSTGSPSPCYRFANVAGSFGYMIKAKADTDNYLLCTFAKEQDGKSIKISVDKSVLFDGRIDSSSEAAVNINLTDTDAENYFQMLIKMPEDIIREKGTDKRMAGAEQQTADSGFVFVPVTFESGIEIETSAGIYIMTYIVVK